MNAHIEVPASDLGTFDTEEAARMAVQNWRAEHGAHPPELVSS